MLCLFLCAAAFNLFGVRTATATGSGGGYELKVRYASVTRPGLATPWSVEISRAASDVGDEEIVVATKSSYFDGFDQNGLSPTPQEESSDGEWSFWTFNAPAPGGTLTVSFDARIEPGVQLARLSGTTELRREGSELVSVDYRTLVLP